MAETSPTITIEQYLAAHPNADPAAMLQVVLEKTALMREENEYRNMEYKAATEVEMDQHFNFKPKTLAQLYRLARMYAESGYVPDHYKGNVPNTAIAIQMALRCHVEIMTFLQASYIVHGKPGIEGKLVTAILNASPAIEGRVDFEYKRENGKIVSCRAYAFDAKTTKELSQEVTWDMVVAEGWDKDKSGKNGHVQISKWKTLPDLMFAYRSATFLGRVHFPDVLMGMYTVEELDDIGETVAVPSVSAATEDMNALSERIGATLQAPPKPTRKRATTKPAEAAASETPTTAEAGPAEDSSENTGPALAESQQQGQHGPAGERAAWLGLQDEAAAAASKGEWAKAERKYREAAGSHPSQDPDNAKVVSLIKKADECRAEAHPATPGPAVPPASHQTTTTRRVPAADKPAAPAKTQPAAPASQAPAGAPTAPRGTAQNPATIGTGKPGWTPDLCRKFLEEKYPQEMVNYDVDRLCEVAASQGAPQIYLQNMMTRTNPAWHKFTAAPAAEAGPVGEEPAVEGSGDVLTEDQLYELDKKDPVPRPPMFSSDGVHFERQLLGYKQAKRVDNLIANDIEPSDSLTNDEVAYLKFLARRRKRELAGQLPLPGSDKLPGMGE